jgi:hypothetical protein
MTTASIPATGVDAFSPEVLADPLPFQAWLRDAGPVVHVATHDVYAFARYEQVHAALVDWQELQSAAAVGLSNFRFEKPWRPPSLLLEADPPRHDAPRLVLSGILGPGRCAGCASGGSPTPSGWWTNCSTVPTSSTPSPPSPRRSRCASSRTPSASARTAGRTCCPTATTCSTPSARRTPWWRRATGGRRSWPRGSARSAPGTRCPATGSAPRSGPRRTAARSPRSRRQIVRSLLSAGVDTTVHGIAAVLHAFATHPEQWRRLRERPDLARVAFDEAVRWQSPVQTFFRTATRDVEIGGTVIPDGSKILMFLGAANRDPRRWSEPDAFRPGPRPVRARRLRDGAAPVHRPARRPGVVDRTGRRRRTAPQQHPPGLGVAAASRPPSVIDRPRIVPHRNLSRPALC